MSARSGPHGWTTAQRGGVLVTDDGDGFPPGTSNGSRTVLPGRPGALGQRLGLGARHSPGAAEPRRQSLAENVAPRGPRVSLILPSVRRGLSGQRQHILGADRVAGEQDRDLATMPTNRAASSASRSRRSSAATRAGAWAPAGGMRKPNMRRRPAAEVTEVVDDVPLTRTLIRLIRIRPPAAHRNPALPVEHRVVAA